MDAFEKLSKCTNYNTGSLEHAMGLLYIRTKTRTDEFRNSKRFRKYVDRGKVRLFEFAKSSGFGSPEWNGNGWGELENTIAITVGTRYNYEMGLEANTNLPFTHEIISNSPIKCPFADLEKKLNTILETDNPTVKDTVHDFITSVNEDMPGVISKNNGGYNLYGTDGNHLCEIIRGEIDELFIDYISLRLATEDDFTLENYSTREMTDADALRLLIDLSNRVYNTYLRIVAGNLIKELVYQVSDKIDNTLDKLEDNCRADYQQKIENLEAKIAKLKANPTIVTTNNTEVKRLENSIKQKDEALLELERRNKKLERLLAENKTEKQPVVSSAEMATSEENKTELNDQGKYVFVVHDWDHLVNKLRNRFPNSVFVGFHDSLPTKVDGCVLLTKHIYHSLYYRAKDYYNKIGVPVIHIHSSNVDVISETMSKEFAEVG